MKALACSSYDYMKLMVAELQRQLDDIDDTPVPIPVTQTQTSPVAPPRTRHNPFNKPENISHNRPHSMRNANPNKPDEPNRFSDPSSASSPSPKVSITFRELHNSYGRPILQDFNIWKRHQRDKAESAVGNLISF